jgi:hemerythrin-like domain-containing protein
MAIQIGAKRDSGFEDPIGMLTDCHRRIEHFVDILCMVVERAQHRALNDEEARAIEVALEYFRVGGARHNADEEESLFPRLGGRTGEESIVELDGLKQDHQTAGSLHTAVENLYRKWLTDQTLDVADWQALSVATKKLKALYAVHIQVEEQVVFPRASKTLDDETIQLIGQEFRNRRAQGAVPNSTDQ